MIQYENHLGTIGISNNYFSNLVGKAASECFGVSGMVENTAAQGLRSLLSQDDQLNKGVRIRSAESGLLIDLHIAVSYGVNISAIVKSIVNKVTYTVEDSTGLEVALVNVFVDDMKA